MRTLRNVAGTVVIAAAMLSGLAPSGAASVTEGSNAPALGQRHMRGPRAAVRGRMGARMFRLLDLTEAQKTQIENIRAKNFAATQSLREQLRTERRAARDFDPNAPFNEQAFREHATRVANIGIELRVAHAKTMREIYDVLTPEQKAKLQELRSNMKERAQKHRGSGPAN